MYALNSDPLCLQDLVTSNTTNSSSVNISNNTTSSATSGNDSCSSGEHSANGLNDQIINTSLPLHPSSLTMHHHIGNMTVNSNQNQHRSLNTQTAVHYPTSHHVNSLFSSLPPSSSSTSSSHHFYNNHHLHHHHHHHHEFQASTLSNTESRLGAHLDANNFLLNPSLESISCPTSEEDTKKVSGKINLHFILPNLS